MYRTPKHIVSAATVVLNDNNQILLLKGPRRGWELPGGQVEEGESLSDQKKKQESISKSSGFAAYTRT